MAATDTPTGKLDSAATASAPVPKRIVNAQTVCNQKNEKGKLCNGHLKQLGTAVNGRGGGKADLAQGSGKGAAGIDAALAALRAEIGRS